MMKNYNIQEEITNLILPLLVIVTIFLVGGMGFDFYYDLNDDVLIKDILSGAYAGIPSGYTNQMLYPIAWLLSGVYKIFNTLPVFGIFLTVCYGLCFYLIGYRSLKFYHKFRTKCFILCLEIAVILGLFLWELIYIQYSVVCGLLAATACFLFYTTPHELSIKDFWKYNQVTVLLVWLAFLIRSEMLLLMTPFFAVVGIYHWYEEVQLQLQQKDEFWDVPVWKKVFQKQNNMRYFGIIGILVFGMLLALLGDSLAYRSGDWKAFRGFFDARTKVYDYTWYPSYENAEEYYRKIGVSASQYQLIDNYNFALDENINQEMLEKVAEYGEKQKNVGTLSERIKNAVWELARYTFSGSNAPYHYFVLAAYGLVLGLAFLQKEKSYLWRLVLLGIMRSIPWLYLIFSQRVVSRISHPLYIIEFMMLAAILMKELHDRPLWNPEKYYRYMVSVLFGILATVGCVTMFSAVREEQTGREEANKNIQAFHKYAKEHNKNYYYFDVYSTVGFSEKIFGNIDNTQKNYDLLGGWISKSPLQKQARQNYLEGRNLSIEEALFAENFFFVIEKQGELSFMKEFYHNKAISVELEKQDIIGDGENPLVVYKVRKK